MIGTSMLRRGWSLVFIAIVAGVAFFGLRWQKAEREIDMVTRDTLRIARDTISICTQLDLQMCTTLPNDRDAVMGPSDNWLCEMNLEHLFDGCVGAPGRDLVTRYARLYYADAPASPEALEKRAVDKVALRREMQAALDVAVAELSKQLGPE